MLFEFWVFLFHIFILFKKPIKITFYFLILLLQLTVDSLQFRLIFFLILHVRSIKTCFKSIFILFLSNLLSLIIKLWKNHVPSFICPCKKIVWWYWFLKINLILFHRAFWYNLLLFSIWFIQRFLITIYLTFYNNTLYSKKIIRRERLFSAFIFTFRWQKTHFTGPDKFSLSDWMPSRNYRLSFKDRFLHERNFQLFFINFKILWRRMISLVDWLSWERAIRWRRFS